MNASHRRHTRYSVPDGAFAAQSLRTKGLIGTMKGWGECRVRDLSIAGALIFTSRRHGPGDEISLRLGLRSGEELVYTGKVVNVSGCYPGGGYKIGVTLHEAEVGTDEFRFLNGMADVFPPAI